MDREHLLEEVTTILIPNANDIKSWVSYPGMISLTTELESVAEDLVRLSGDQDGDFYVKYAPYLFRAVRFKTVSGDHFTFRKMPKEIWSMSKCGLPGHLRDQIKNPDLSDGGLIIICGKPGRGKSTTCAAMISERLKTQAGVCITIEDPPEMPLHGTHEKGICIQRGLSKGEVFNDAIKESLRAYPAGAESIMLIGEMRDNETAALTVKSAIDGRLVLVTLHAAGIIEAIQRLVTSAADGNGMSISVSRELVGSAIRMVIHQDFNKNGELVVNTLYATQQTQSLIRGSAPLENLASEIEQQKKMHMMKQKIRIST
jgi:twitching motility protein PilT